MAERHPNVVVLISHDTGRLVSPYGVRTVDTPSLAALAGRSATFENAFCTTPLCAPSRAALVTGLYPHQNGMNGLPGDHLGGWELETKDRHLAAVLGRHGYATVQCGFLHETRDLFSVGFQDAIHGIGKGNNGGRPLAGAEDAIAAWLERHAAAAPSRPFYLQIGCQDTHREWSRYAEPYTEKGIWRAPYLIDDPAIDAEMACMQGAVRGLDTAIGRILAVFEERGLADHTVFCVTTDHGIDFPRAKGTLFDPGVEVMLFLRHRAGGWREGVRLPELVSQVDLYPTLLDACGVPLPGPCEGRSLVPLLSGHGAFTPRSAVYLEKTYHDNYDPMRGLRTDRWKYVLNFDAQTLYDVRIATAPRYNWFRFPFKKTDREELYDLRQDPQETRNLAAEPQWQDQRERLRTDLAVWMAQTQDPLLDGPIVSPVHRRTSLEMASRGRAARQGKT